MEGEERQEETVVYVTDIIQQVAESYGISTDELLHGDRRRKFSEPRHVAMYLCHRLLGMTQETIGASFAKNRTLALYAIKKIADCVADPQYNRRAAECVTTILWNLKNDRK